MFSWLSRRKPKFHIAEDDWQATLAEARLVGARPADELERLNALCAEFLARKRFSATHDLVLDERKCRLIAVQACLPVLNLGFDWLKGWREVIVYPGQFRVRRHDHDEDTQVVSEWDDELAGESWSHGPIVLSWADIEQDLAEPFEGFNVVIHEIAHKLDGLDGALDGAPPLPGAARRRRWAEVGKGRDTVLDPYAAEAEDEFFAVVSEYYFTAPDVLAEHHPEVHAEFRAFYGPVPVPNLA